MSNATTDHNIRQLPIYRQGWRDGHDLGLRQGLDIITLERNQLADDLIIAKATDDARHAAVLTYADGRLHAVAQRVAGIFRQAI